MDALFPPMRRRPRGVRGRPRRRGAVALLACACALVAWAGAQPVDAGRGEVTIGLGGNLVAGAWNPLRVTVRDAPSSTLDVRIDEGDLVSGPRLVRYRASVPGGSGVSVFDDQIYVPVFQTLSWSLTDRQGVLASGSLGARDADGRPLQVVISSDPGAWRGAFASDARVVDVAASDLPTSAAGYDGVATLLLDGTAAAPRTEAVAAAAAGGVDVLLAGALPASQAGLERLAGSGSSRLGAGRVARVAPVPGAVAAALAGWRPTERGRLLSALAAKPLVTPPRSAPQPTVLALAAGYALLTLLALRFGGTPGTVAAVALAVVVSLAGWRLLRPPAAELDGHRGLMLGGGALALAIEVDERLTLPAGEVSVTTPARPLTAVPYATDGSGTHVALARWHGVSLALRPSLVEAALRSEGGRLRNAGASPLQDVYVVGMGAQGTLAPGASREVRPGEEGPATPEMARFAALLPRGTALAEGPRALWVALPPDAGPQGSGP